MAKTRPLDTQALLRRCALSNEPKLRCCASAFDAATVARTSRTTIGYPVAHVGNASGRTSACAIDILKLSPSAQNIGVQGQTYTVLGAVIVVARLSSCEDSWDGEEGEDDCLNGLHDAMSLGFRSRRGWEVG